MGRKRIPKGANLDLWEIANKAQELASELAANPEFDSRMAAVGEYIFAGTTWLAIKEDLAAELCFRSAATCLDRLADFCARDESEAH